MSQFWGFQGRFAACLHLSGADALSFVRSQVTVAVPDPAQHRWVYGLWLNENGRVLADSHVWALADDSCLLWSYACPAEQLSSTVERNRIADDVELTDLSADYEGSLLTPAASQREAVVAVLDRMELPWPARGEAIEGEDFLALGGSPLGPDTLTFIGPAPFHERLREALGQALPGVPAGALSSSAFDHARLAKGVPFVPRDLNHRNLPQEGNLPAPVIDYGKGCFPGQEIMASFRKSGRISKRLRTVEIELAAAAALELPAPVYAGASEVGTLTSAATWQGTTLGLVMLRERAAGRELELKGPDGTSFGVRLRDA